ncbi:hypothetical protein HELRODRAFT_177732 [Helobdella robusta]|uniref:WSC domain-containing protein n=1 Tax=Helobdella robusta TaxID=6412 RepID=T1FC55_HELRO|nr:hypothetical protein HELRODRAFT_177732 [Helobdella robusta]ESN97677.1 hypothetical protein HELRODRAFT_177732 [Helobdella robusta]
MAPIKLSLVVFVVLLASCHPTAAIERVNDTILTLWNHKGCYQGVFIGTAVVSVLECFIKCSGLQYYGIKSASICRCQMSQKNNKGQKIFGVKVEETKCDKLCSDGFPCGGNQFFSFYEMVQDKALGNTRNYWNVLRDRIINKYILIAIT